LYMARQLQGCTIRIAYSVKKKDKTWMDKAQYVILGVFLKVLQRDEQEQLEAAKEYDQALGYGTQAKEEYEPAKKWFLGGIALEELWKATEPSHADADWHARELAERLNDSYQQRSEIAFSRVTDFYGPYHVGWAMSSALGRSPLDLFAGMKK